MGAALEIFLSKVVPILGGLIAIAMYASPVKAVYTARQQGNIGVSSNNCCLQALRSPQARLAECRDTLHGSIVQLH